MSLIPVLLLTGISCSFLLALIVRKQRPRGIREKSSQFIQNVIGKLLAGFVIVLYICYLYNFFSPFCSLMASLPQFFRV
jgi:NhaP-type Na+/H+ or K+/H+ antiporter